MGPVFLAGEKPHERPSLSRSVIPERASERWIGTLQRVENRAQRGRAVDLQLHLAIHARQYPQMCRQHYSDHGSVWTSTESTLGRSRAMGAQLSPALAEAYTCPPVVPKYTPHLSSESTAIASRSTLT
jgi:hypothetical protein